MDLVVVSLFIVLGVAFIVMMCGFVSLWRDDWRIVKRQESSRAMAYYCEVCHHVQTVWISRDKASPKQMKRLCDHCGNIGPTWLAGPVTYMHGPFGGSIPFMPPPDEVFAK